ncbi:hypothetical protein TOPH_09045 [Tolypocladium ophioglossoides CBS 100239]|uniref:Uncharacterized protein n=1 Tax=Tolypocladium ophioglossoides (strain CBS 100239) TaxID=1163406 RepID=A0A0L0MX35_TOLOC|nr:hypothetical protein TOPH_09045 [Tolypocladium ophioglossoides CBS 100239]
MAPTKRGDETAAGGAPPETGIGNKVCVILVIAFAGVCVLGIAAGLICKWYKRRRQYHEIAEKNSPALLETLSGRKASSTFRADDGHEDHQELQRQRIISKSLASRVSLRETFCTTQPNDTEEQASAEPCAQDRGNGESATPLESPVGLVNDWKRWEAKLRQDNTRSLTFHPGVDKGLHPLHNHAAPLPPTAYLAARRPLTYPTGTTDCPSISPNIEQTYRLYSPLPRTDEMEDV